MFGSLLDYFAGRNVVDVARDVVDVAIVYYLVYRALLVLRGTRAMQVGIGLLLVFVLYVVAYQLHFVTLLSVLGALIPGAVILILVVVFQNDIRRGLMRMGSQPWFGIARARESQAIDEVVEAATELARHRIGAIIAFEQDANLDEFVGLNKGHTLDSVVSSELLVSIFVPEGVNKLHDGAVIIRDLRIAKAGVFFPMPDGRVLDPSFGSRHRAALGITEETDAVVVVVSEERGTISFCFNGNIVGNLDGPGLRRALEGVFSPRRRRAKTVAKRDPISARLGPDSVLITRAPEAPRSRADTGRQESPEDATLISMPSEHGETPTTRIRTTEPEIERDRPPSQPPPAPLRRAKADKDKDKSEKPVEKGETEPPSLVIPGAGRIQRLPPQTTPMRAPSVPRSPRSTTTEPNLRTPPSDDGGRAPRLERRRNDVTEVERIWKSVSRWVTDAVTENLGLKALSLVVALGLAAYTRGQLDRTQRTIPVGVVLRLPQERLHRELMTPMPANVDVTVGGTTRAIDRLIQTGISPVELDLRDGTSESVAFEKNMFSVPPDIELKFVDPPSISLEWQDVVTRTIPIQASRAGQPAKGYEVKDTLEVDPKEIDVKGPESLVEVLQFARLAAFDVTGLTEGVYRRRLAIDDPPSRVRFLGSKSATVTVVVTRHETELKFDRRPVEVVGMPRARAIPALVDVTVTGAPETVIALRADQIVPRVDLASAGIDLKSDAHGSTTLKVRVELGNAEAECQPPTVTVRW